ncbi:hypothetical protein PXJ25_28425, partial [Klebsiella pneumoniae]
YLILPCGYRRVFRLASVVLLSPSMMLIEDLAHKAIFLFGFTPSLFDPPLRLPPGFSLGQRSVVIAQHDVDRGSGA